MKVMKDDFYDKLEQAVWGSCIAGYISKQEMMDTMDDVQEFIDNAEDGDVYTYEGIDYCIDCSETDDDDE